uniref:Uncharacterized protein n=1 Tax=Arundo donax TaxID=35708 RepID=A0A0A8Y3Y5_ARUDO
MSCASVCMVPVRFLQLHPAVLL